MIRQENLENNRNNYLFEKKRVSVVKSHNFVLPVWAEYCAITQMCIIYCQICSNWEDEIRMYYLKVLNQDTKKQICDITISRYVYKDIL